VVFIGENILDTPGGLCHPQSGSNFEHFCSIVAPRRWQEVFLLMLTVCFDAGGKDDTAHKVITVAGFASFSGVWAEFERRWSDRLRVDHLPYFHAGEFAHSTGAFKDGWKGNKERRDRLSSDLMNVIRDCGLRKFGSIVSLVDFRDWRKDRPFNRAQAFAFAAIDPVEAFHSYAWREGIKNNVRYVFEKGDSEDQLRWIFRHRGYIEPDFAWSKPHVDRKGFAYDPFLGLQAAGWIAYEFYLDADRVLRGEPTERWPLRQFQSLPGTVTVRRLKELA
jgi:hypothetical protein